MIEYVFCPRVQFSEFEKEVIKTHTFPDGYKGKREYLDYICIVGCLCTYGAADLYTMCSDVDHLYRLELLK